jgi:hypothetical protein
MVRIVMSWSILGVIIPLSSSSVLKHNSQLKVSSQLFRILHGPRDDNPDWLISFGGWRFVETNKQMNCRPHNDFTHIMMVCWSYHTVIMCSMFSPDLGSTGKMAQMNAEEPLLSNSWMCVVWLAANGSSWGYYRKVVSFLWALFVWSLSVNLENQTWTCERL